MGAFHNWIKKWKTLSCTTLNIQTCGFVKIFLKQVTQRVVALHGTLQHYRMSLIKVKTFDSKVSRPKCELAAIKLPVGKIADLLVDDRR